ncbi:MAG: TraB/GumN family protein [Hyphomonadaceae bacterium]
MIRTIGAALLALTVLGGCVTANAQSAADNAYAGQGPALFVARDADSTLYLYSTIHIRKPNTVWAGPNAQAGLAEASEIWTELLMSPEAEANGQRIALQLAMAPADRPLSSRLSAEDYARLEALCAQLGFPVAVMNAWEPWFAAVTLSVLPAMRAGYDPMSGVDRQVDRFGDEHGKTMRAFETMEQQLGFLSGFSDEVEVQWLVESIMYAEMGVAYLDAMSLAWESGDIAMLEELVVDTMREQSPDVYNVLLVQRNNAWMPMLMTELEGSGVDFVAVGAGHLLGPDGLVAQLRARGVTVERVAP